MLVRHAEAVAPSDPHHEENDRPLTDAGRRDAERLAGALAAEAADAIYSSPYPRAVQTVEPFARRVGTEISLVGAPAAGVDGLRVRARGRGIVRRGPAASHRGAGDAPRAPHRLADRGGQPRQPDRTGAPRDRPRPGRLRVLGRHAHAGGLSAPRRRHGLRARTRRLRSRPPASRRRSGAAHGRPSAPPPPSAAPRTTAAALCWRASWPPPPPAWPWAPMPGRSRSRRASSRCRNGSAATIP